MHLPCSHWLVHSSVAGQLARHSCLSLSTRVSVTQGGLGNLNFIFFWIKSLYSLLFVYAFSILWTTCLETPDPDRNSQQHHFEAQASLLPHPHRYSQIQSTNEHSGRSRTLCKEMGIKAIMLRIVMVIWKGRIKIKLVSAPFSFDSINKARDYCLTSLLWGTHKRRLLGHVFNPVKTFISQPVTTLGVSDLSVALKFVSTKLMFWVECFR